VKAMEVISNAVMLHITAPIGSVLRVESTDSAAAPWQYAGTVTASSAITIFSDTGQNGRISPALAPARYYRVIGN
jgi:hypothetical protein